MSKTRMTKPTEQLRFNFLVQPLEQPGFYQATLETEPGIGHVWFVGGGHFSALQRAVENLLEQAAAREPMPLLRSLQPTPMQIEK